MVCRISHVFVVAASFAMGVALTTPTFAAPINPVKIGKGVASSIDQASFWGRPYPYGYGYRPYRHYHRHIHVRRPIRVRG